MVAGLPQQTILKGELAFGGCEGFVIWGGLTIQTLAAMLGQHSESALRVRYYVAANFCMGQNIELELKVVKGFVDNRRQERYLQFIAQPKNRQKFLNELPHFQDLKWSLFEQVNKDERQILLALVQKYKLTDKNCYIISFDPEIDTETREVKQAIEEVVNYNIGTILVFGDAELIFYGGEELKSRYVSKWRL